MIRIFFYTALFFSITLPAYAGFEFTPPMAAKNNKMMGDKIMPPPAPAPLMPVDQADLNAPLPPAPPEAGMKSLSIDDANTAEEGVMIRRNKPKMNWEKAPTEEPPTAPMAKNEPTILAPTAPPNEENIMVPENAVAAPPLPEPPPSTSDVFIEPQPIEPLQPMADSSVLEGFGRDVPLALALQQMVPPGFAYALAPNVNAGVSLSWSGGKSWIEELNQALAVHNYSASVRNKTVLITAPGSIAAFPASPIADEVFNQTAPVMVENNISMESKRTWQAQAGDSLRRVLTDWSSAAGVTLYWPTESDYVLTKPITIKGNYAEAVDSVLTAFAALTPRPMGKLHTNKNVGAPVLSIQES